MTVSANGKKPDFSGWATRFNVLCDDGRTILPTAFKKDDGKRVSLVWQHTYDSPANILGHAYLYHKPEGIRFDAFLNGSKEAEAARVRVKHKDIENVSIYANQLIQSQDLHVHDGVIRELSLTLSGKNSGAFIDIVHSTDGIAPDGQELDNDFEGIIFAHSSVDEESEESINHSTEKQDMGKTADNTTLEHGGRTLAEIFNGLDQEEQDMVAFLVAKAKEEGGAEHGFETYSDDLVHSTFGRDNPGSNYAGRPAILSDETFSELMHSGMDSHAASFLSHAVTYGIENIEYLFPDFRRIGDIQHIERDQTWVDDVFNGVDRSPISRIKTVGADLTHDAALARGYIKGTLKKDSFFTLITRTTEPTTVFIKNKFDRDDLLDIQGVEGLTLIRYHQNSQLREKIARSVLFGDGLLITDPDKVRPDKIRPIAMDDDLFCHKVVVAADDTTEEIVDGMIEAHDVYEGSGTPTMFMSRKLLTKMLLLRDTNKKRMYRNVEELASELRVSKIVPVQMMDTVTRVVEGVDPAPDVTQNLLAVMVNLKDYTMGAQQGGEITSFQQFDIDFNQEKFLMETRSSGALTKVKGAVAFYQVVAG